MGGGDLNAKKSWHPSIRRNAERVYKEEKAALEERKVIEKLRKEREEERATEELQRLQAEAGGKVVTKRVDWMYGGPGGDGTGITEEREGYLLGKRRIDGLLKGDTQGLQKGAAVGVEAVGAANANSARDTQKKVLEDPLLMIQKQKMSMQIKAMKDAQKQKQYEEKRSKERDRERKHRHRHSHSRRDRSRSRSSDRDDRERRRHRHRRDNRDDHRRRSRSRSPRRREADEDRVERDTYRRRSRSRSPYRKSHRTEHRAQSRSRSPRRRDDRSGWDRNVGKNQDSSYRSYDRRLNNGETQSRRPQPPVVEPTESKEKESMDDRLAKMQADASSLEEQRNERVRLREAEDAAAEEQHKKNRDGGHRFMSGIRGKVTDMDLGDVISRGRQNYRKEVDV